MKLAFRFGLLVWFLAASLVAASAEGPEVEFGLGLGMFNYQIDTGYSGSGGLYDGVSIKTYAATIQTLSATNASVYKKLPYSGSPVAINTTFLVRFPLGPQFGLAYSNRVAFAFEKVIHRADYTVDLDPVLTMAGLTGAELEYYPNGHDSGIWVSGLGGISVLNQPFVKAYLTQLGVGGGGTLGWRYSPTSAIELNVLYLRTFLPGWTIDKIPTLWGDASGVSFSVAYRFGFL